MMLATKQAAEPFNPSPVPHDRFFSDYYRTVSELLKSFSDVRSDILRWNTTPAKRAQLLDLSCRGAELGLEVLGYPERQSSAASIELFVDRILRIEGLIALSSNPGIVAGAHEINKHWLYFKERVPSAIWPIALGPSDPSPMLTIDFVTNGLDAVAKYVFGEYRWACEDPRKSTNFFDASVARAQVSPASQQLMDTASAELDGWCSPQKALLLYSLVRENRPQTIVEIGIFGGRSIVPMACALRDNREGQVYGIETWSASEATAYRTALANDFFWMNADFSSIKGKFLDFILRHRLYDQVRVIEAPSQRCASLFDRIDLLHIDGGHSTFGAAQDVVNYVPRVPSGGIVVYDDIEWATTAAGLEILRDSCSLMHVAGSQGNPEIPGCAVFRKI